MNADKAGNLSFIGVYLWFQEVSSPNVIFVSCGHFRQVAPGIPRNAAPVIVDTLETADRLRIARTARKSRRDRI